jgi:hypothetical protein
MMIVTLAWRKQAPTFDPGALLETKGTPEGHEKRRAVN